MAEGGTVPIPGVDAAHQDTVDCAVVDGGTHVAFLQPFEAVQLLRLFHHEWHV